MYYFLDICGDLLFELAEDQRISLASPGYPHPYPINTDCSWLILAKGAGQPTLTVMDFEIYHGFDVVNIGHDINVIMSLTGTRAPSSVTVNATSVTVHFDSYHWDYGLKGFLFQMFWSPQNGKYLSLFLLSCCQIDYAVVHLTI